MTEARSVLIRAGAGRVRVLRLFAGAQTYALRYTVALNQAMCRVCGCTKTYGCAGGCGWVNASKTLCSRCSDRIAR